MPTSGPSGQCCQLFVQQISLGLEETNFSQRQFDFPAVAGFLHWHIAPGGPGVSGTTRVGGDDFAAARGGAAEIGAQQGAPAVVTESSDSGVWRPTRGHRLAFGTGHEVSFRNPRCRRNKTHRRGMCFRYSDICKSRYRGGAQNCVNTHLFCSLRLVFERDADFPSYREPTKMEAVDGGLRVNSRD